MEGHYGNAMTEIALALAMAFFSVMVLAMVSMGAGGAGSSDVVEAVKSATADTLRVSPSKPSNSTQPAADKSRIIVFYQGRYLSDQLKPIALSSINQDEKIILAIDPALSLSGALDARAALTTQNITVTTLDQRWMRALEETEK
ncbi:MAG: hypothetical protein HOE62_04475 [Alphaproteobacteria bacterium]|jgi:hypothetical protein|nr:hypothetical protein [Alphaproteobacteria bacterium]MBT4017179.1 hypothetical protein [Alphaproteobacteria bacterium]MBT4966265.1 hypothetical protein [Alphaproteobacteria bacterium]MBT5159172.1 hypothetical protein [Alphaproteobacteria bacterium]MBT6384779.1 hypothetical protein [Alphaproteobacteria bacterium]